MDVVRKDVQHSGETMHRISPGRLTTVRLVSVAIMLVMALVAVSLPSSALGQGNQSLTSRSADADTVASQGRPTRPPRPGGGPVATAPATSTRPPRNATQVPATQAPATQAPATQPPSTGGGSYGCPTGEEIVMLGLINNFRAQNGVRALTLSSTLTAAADFHSQDMANRNYFSHDLPGIGSWAQNIYNYGYAGGTIAENIAAGYGDAASTVNSWINSPGHRANMLNPNLTAIGIGSAYNPNSQYGTYWTNTFGGSVDSAIYC